MQDTRLGWSCERGREKLVILIGKFWERGVAYGGRPRPNFGQRFAAASFVFFLLPKWALGSLIVGPLATRFTRFKCNSSSAQPELGSTPPWSPSQLLLLG